MLKYLIDGNNVIHANKNWKKICNDDPDKAKDLLIQKVVDYFKDSQNRATIFFDGFNFVYSHTQISRNVEIKHSKNKTADETILSTIQKEKNKKNLVIITNDIELTRKTKIHQCQVRTSDEFINMIEIIKTTDESKPEKVSKSEVEYWLNIFKNKKRIE